MFYVILILYIYKTKSRICNLRKHFFFYKNVVVLLKGENLDL